MTSSCAENFFVSRSRTGAASPVNVSTNSERKTHARPRTHTHTVTTKTGAKQKISSKLESFKKPQRVMRWKHGAIGRKEQEREQVVQLPFIFFLLLPLFFFFFLAVQAPQRKHTTGTKTPNV